MKKPLTALTVMLLLSLLLGLFFAPTGPRTAIAATASPKESLTQPMQPVKDISDLLEKIVTSTPKWTFSTRKPKTMTEITPIPNFSTATPKPNEPNPQPSSGGKFMTSEGPLFLSFRDDLTERLYMFTPMDLSIDAEYHFPLIGSSEQVVGDAKVTVAAGMVTVSYFLVNGVKLDRDDEFFTFFKDIDSITTLKTSKLQKAKLRFGVPYDVAGRLKSDPNVLLYINCPVSYKTNLNGLAPFSFDDPGYMQRVSELLPLMD